MVLYSPRDTPIRFNRKRQKIYVYEFQRKWNPWVHWPTVIKVYDWKDIRAEMSYEAGRYNQGYRLYGAVCLPGTDQVLERFVLSWSVGHPKLLYGLWSHCCLYMRNEEVPERPLFHERPREWCPWDNVYWPADIDRESTTAPDSQD